MNQLSFTNPLVDVPATYARGEVAYSSPTPEEASGGAEKGMGQTPGTEPSCPTPDIKDPVPPPCPTPDPSGDEGSAVNGTFGKYPRAREDRTPEELKSRMENEEG